MRKNPVIFIILSLFFSFEANAQSWRSTSFDDRPVCEEFNGVWRQFGNGCGDGCESKFDQFSICTQSLIFACDCGRGRCWDDGACVPLADYKKAYDIKQAKRQKILNKGKADRKAASDANRRQVIRKLLIDLVPKDPNDDNQSQDPTDPITQIAAPKQATHKAVEIPPFFLKKQAMLEAERQRKLKEEGGGLSGGSGIPEGLPEIPLPN